MVNFKFLLSGAAAAVFVGAVGVVAAGGASAGNVACSQGQFPTPPAKVTCEFPVGLTEWTVPQGVTSITVDLYGAQGGNGDDPMGLGRSVGGKGGHAMATLDVTPGQSLQINVGGQGATGNDVDWTKGGYNGGGDGSSGAGGGGGASDIRTGAFGLDDIVFLAGGGGGSGGYYGDDHSGNGPVDVDYGGGDGGGSEGTGGKGGDYGCTSSAGKFSYSGGPGTALAGGQGGAVCQEQAFSSNGKKGVGGDGYSADSYSGGGGGGYNGGGGGGSNRDLYLGLGGGGGAGFIDYSQTTWDAILEAGKRTGSGSVAISYTVS